jgi:hypothetical protein
LGNTPTTRDKKNAQLSLCKHDATSRLLSIVRSTATNQFARFDYTLNAVGNRTSKTQTTSPT